jgi:hypothetical protein
MLGQFLITPVQDQLGARVLDDTGF